MAARQGGAMKNPSGIKGVFSADGSTVVIVTSGGSLQYSTDKVRLSAAARVPQLSLMWQPTLSVKYF